MTAMALKGEPVSYKANAAVAQLNGSKEDRQAKGLRVNAQLQRFLKVQELASNVPVAQAALDAVKGEAAKLENTIVKLRQAAANTGKPDPTIIRKVAELAELPAMVAAAQARLEAAQQAYTAAKEAMEADERADAAEAAVEREMRQAAVERAKKIEEARTKARAAK